MGYNRTVIPVIIVEPDTPLPALTALLMDMAVETPPPPPPRPSPGTFLAVDLFKILAFFETDNDL